MILVILFILAICTTEDRVITCIFDCAKYIAPKDQIADTKYVLLGSIGFKMEYYFCNNTFQEVYTTFSGYSEIHLSHTDIIPPSCANRK